MKAFVAIFLLMAAATNADVNSRITGGTVAKLGGYKSFVAIEADFERGLRTCGGYLDVRMDRIVTAASCVFDAIDGKASSVRLAFGQTNDFTRNKIKIKNIYKTGAFNPAKQPPVDDIAVIMLAAPVTRTTAIEGQALVSTGEAADFFVGQSLTVCGFGVLDNQKTKAKSLQCTGLLVVPMAECTAAIPKPAGERKKRQEAAAAAAAAGTQICTKNIDDSNVCSGDFGSPVFVSANGLNTVVGVVSYYPDSRSNAHCQDGHYVVSTEVGGYKDFLSDPAKPPPKK